MTPEEKLDLIRRYQSNPYVHALTCQNRGDGRHSFREGETDLGVLVGVVGDDGVVQLACRDCDYRQAITDDLWRIIRFGSAFTLQNPLDGTLRS